MHRRSFFAAVASLVGGLVNFKLLPAKDRLLGANSGFPFVDEAAFSSFQEVQREPRAGEPVWYFTQYLCYWDVEWTLHFFPDASGVVLEKPKTQPMLKLYHLYWVVYEGPLPTGIDLPTLDGRKGPFQLGGQWYQPWSEHGCASIRPDEDPT